MRTEIRRPYAGETRWGIFTNLNNQTDMLAVGGWYFIIHAPLAHIEMYRVTR